MSHIDTCRLSLDIFLVVAHTTQPYTHMSDKKANIFHHWTEDNSLLFSNQEFIE
jgi:hypothetical protein